MTTTAKSTEQVNHPPHYTAGGLEVIDVIKAKLTPEEWKGYLRGNCLKYLLRADYKGQKVDIEKMMWYAERLKDCYPTKEEATKVTLSLDDRDPGEEWITTDSLGKKWKYNLEAKSWQPVK